MEPTLETKHRLRQKFGLYSANWKTPFGPGQLIPSNDDDCCFIRMVGVDEDAREPPRDKGLSPFVRNLVSKVTQPKFSGHEADFADFSREWKQFMRVMCPGGVDQENDVLVLEILKSSLDPASQNKLAALLEQNPDLTYMGYWRELEKDFCRDFAAHYRREWEKVSLNGVRHPTPNQWRTFVSNFELKCLRVEDATDREKEERILAELPADLRRKLKEENFRISHN